MRIRIRHETHYELETAARRTMQYLRLSPRFDRNQRILHWSVSGPDQLTKWVDGFGNTVLYVAEHADHHDLAVVVEGEVETRDTGGVLPLDDGLPPAMFLRPRPLIEPDQDIIKFVGKFERVRQADGDIAFLHALMVGVGEEIEYESGHSTVSCLATEAFARKKAVCQDFAHVFISACHVAGVPARYVSGYIADGVGEAASHAWAESYVSDLGWVSFDPSNQQSATDAYVRLAIGYDYASVAPVIGVRTGGKGEKMNVSVQVNQVQN